MPFEIKENDDGQEIKATIQPIDHKHEWYKDGKWVKCRTCTIQLLDDDNTFIKVLKQNETK